MRQSEIEQLLPEVMQQTLRTGGPLVALLGAMEALHEPSEEVLARLDGFFDPYRTPDGFVPFLARWVDLDRLLAGSPEELTARSAPVWPSGLGRLRQLIASAAYLSTWRGTARGLLQFLTTATGLTGFTVEEQPPGPDGQPRPFHLRVHAPAEAGAFRPLIERIVEAEKPAYVTWELAVGG